LAKHERYYPANLTGYFNAYVFLGKYPAIVAGYFVHFGGIDKNVDKIITFMQDRTP